MTIKVVYRFMRLGAPRFEYAPGYVFDYDPACEDYDWLVVYDELCEENIGTFLGGREELRCPREHTILATWEPVSIKCYSRPYTRQFGHLLSNRPQESECHPHYHLGRGYFDWFVDRNYREVEQTEIQPKTKDVSIVCSSKQMRRTRHYDRFRLATALVHAIPGTDWYGHGVRGFGKKYEVLDPYRYHVAVENHIAPHHWTEKLADAFLCECLPFYAGDPAIFEVFPKESLIPIPIDDPEESIRIVKAAIASDEYSRRRGAVQEAKRLILTRYNFWAQVIEVIEVQRRLEAASPIAPADGPQFLYNRKVLRKRNLAAALEEGFFHFKQYVYPFGR